MRLGRRWKGSAPRPASGGGGSWTPTCFAVAGGRVVILGGTAEGFALAARLDRCGVEVITSLAGRVKEPRRPAGRLRVGHFGGAQALAEYLKREGVDAV